MIKMTLDEFNELDDDQVHALFLELGLPEFEKVMTSAEVARVFSVCDKTVMRWARVGYLKSFRTLGQHRRYWRPQIERYLIQSLIESQVTT